jgi:TRAP-type C4-dicarboxylate transport system substrate-binding protein
MTNHNYTATIIAMSPVLWEKFSPEDQKLVREVWIEAQNKGREKTEILAEQFVKVISDYGVKIYYPTSAELQQFQDTVKPVWKKVEQNMGTEGYNKLIDFVKDYSEKHKK